MSCFWLQAVKLVWTWNSCGHLDLVVAHLLELGIALLFVCVVAADCNYTYSSDSLGSVTFEAEKHSVSVNMGLFPIDYLSKSSIVRYEGT